jgi:hypothetical protein
MAGGVPGNSRKYEPPLSKERHKGLTLGTVVQLVEGESLEFTEQNAELIHQRLFPNPQVVSKKRLRQVS